MNLNQYRGKLLSLKPISEELGISTATLRRWCKLGKIKSLNLSTKTTRVDGSSLADFLEQKGAENAI